MVWDKCHENRQTANFNADCTFWTWLEPTHWHRSQRPAGVASYSWKQFETNGMVIAKKGKPILEKHAYFELDRNINRSQMSMQQSKTKFIGGKWIEFKFRAAWKLQTLLEHSPFLRDWAGWRSRDKDHCWLKLGVHMSVNLWCFQNSKRAWSLYGNYNGQ